jgi:cobalt-zinc-cadmium resistance protein CzcA
MIATMVALAGLVPAALSTGIGSQSQKPFAIVIVGGLLPATILTLLLLPALYEWFEGRRPSKSKSEELEAEEESDEEPGPAVSETEEVDLHARVLGVSPSCD